jgi:hypothetical protein
MLIKLDSGEYVDTDSIENIFELTTGWYVGLKSGRSQDITEEDRDRIAKEMNGDDSDVNVYYVGKNPLGVRIGRKRYYLKEAGTDE